MNNFLSTWWPWIIGAIPVVAGWYVSLRMYFKNQMRTHVKEQEEWIDKINEELKKNRDENLRISQEVYLLKREMHEAKGCCISSCFDTK